MYWVGLWNLLNLYVLPEYSVPNGHLWRDALYVVLGTAGNVIIKIFWPQVSVQQQPGEPFRWRNHLLRYLRLFCSVSLGIVFWTGAWNYIDASWYTSSRNRELLYMCLSVPLLFLLDVIFSSPVLRHLLVLDPDPNLRYEDDNIFSVWN